MVRLESKTARTAASSLSELAGAVGLGARSVVVVMHPAGITIGGAVGRVGGLDGREVQVGVRQDQHVVVGTAEGLHVPGHPFAVIDEERAGHHAGATGDAAQSALAIRVAEAQGEHDRDRIEHDVFSERFLIKRPLLQALEPDTAGAPVLLIDELDRADEAFEAFLLEVLADFQVTIPELGTIKAAQPPIVVITSNRTREIHDALKRRCLYHWVGYPTAEREPSIVRAKVPGVSKALSAQVVHFVQALRKEDLFKSPGVAETLDWASALAELDVVALDPATVSDTLGVLLCVSEPTCPGCVIKCRMIGLFDMEDEHGLDSKLLCVPCNDPLWSTLQRLEDLPQQLRNEIGHFFAIYKDLEPGKESIVKGWRDQDAAVEELKQSRRRYAEQQAPV